MATLALVNRFEAEAGSSAPNHQDTQEQHLPKKNKEKPDPTEGQNQGAKETGGRGEERPRTGSNGGGANKTGKPGNSKAGGPTSGSQGHHISDQDRDWIQSSLGATYDYSSEEETGVMDYENGRSKRRLSRSPSGSSDHDREAKKGKTLDDSFSSLVSPLSDEEEEGSDGSFIRVTRGNKKSHKVGGDVGGHSGLQKSRVGGNSPKSNATAFEDSIKDKEVGLGGKTVETVFIFFNLIGKGLKHAALTQFAKGFNTYVGGCISSHLHPNGISFRIRGDQTRKARAYTDPNVDSRTPTISITPPIIRKPTPEQNKSKQKKVTRSYAVLDLSFMDMIENVKSLFDLKKWGITDVSAMSDKRGQKTGRYKMTFSTQTPPIELPELGTGLIHPLEPYYMNYVRCNKCQKFGHLKRFCKSRTSVCPQCAGKHTFAQCKATRSNRKCANCGLLTHGAAYRGCSAYQNYMRKIDDSNAQIHSAWSLRMAKPSQTPRTVPDPWVGSTKIPTNLPVPQPTFTQRQLEEATAAARHEGQKETLKAVADMLGSLGIMTSTGHTLTNESIRQRIEEMYPGIPTPDTQPEKPKQPEPEPCVIPDTQNSVVPDTQKTRDIPDIRNTREISETPATGRPQCAPNSRKQKYASQEISELPVPISPRTQHAVAYKPPQKIRMNRKQQTANGRKIVQSRLADTQRWVDNTPKTGKIVKKANSAPAKAGRK
ncbi:MAG: hypothetical protein AB2768_08585 [Candidatus Thiodiazotropha endolucinida]